MNKDRVYKSIIISLATILTSQIFLSEPCVAEQNRGSGWESLFKFQKDDEWFAEDKAKHFAVSFLLAAGAYYSINVSTNKDSSAIIGATSFSIGLGLLKEFKDVKDGKFWSNKDLIWDVIGAGVAVSIASQVD
ncbi:MAG: hypothetical protein ACUZ8O_14520 [Candidatus Anammoxibacter sp.]